MRERLPIYDSNTRESTEKKIDRRTFIKTGLTAASVVMGESLIQNTEGIAANLEKLENKVEELTDKEKVIRFTNLLNSLKDQIPKMREGDSGQYSYFNNCGFIYKLLVKDRDLLDEETYHAFAYLQSTQNKKDFSMADLDEALAYVIGVFVDHGYYFNVYNQIKDEKLFIESIKRSVNVSQYDGIVALHPENSKGRTYISYIDYDRQDKNDIILGSTVYGYIFINISEIDRFYNEKLVGFKEKYSFLKDKTREDLIKYIESNELSHRIMINLYKFSVRTEYNWSIVDSGIPDYEIKDSNYVDEFLSDAVSMITDPEIGLAIILSTNGFKEEYGYSLEFMKKLLNDKIIEKGIETEEDWTDKERFQALLKVISDQDIEDIKNAYMNQAKLLISEIKKINIEA